jgi:DNA-binding transcriptional regulator YdaS (Cro superfamily)
MAELGVAPAFGLTGFRRALAISVAAVALTSVFLVVRFPYDRLAPRAAAAIESATGTRVTIGRLGLGVAWFAAAARLGRERRVAQRKNRRLPEHRRPAGLVDGLAARRSRAGSRVALAAR